MKKMIFSVNINQVSDLQILVYISYFQLYLTFVHLLIVFDCNPPLDVRGIFLDISNAFDRVCHNGLTCKIKCIRINGMFLKLITGFFENRFQSCFKWLDILMGTSASRCTSGLCFRASVVPYLHKWPVNQIVI